MKAAVFRGPRQIEVRSDVARPRIAANEVLVQVQACGICGSDLHVYRVQTPLTDLMHSSGVLLVDPDGHAIPGHEFSGVIVETGAEVVGYRVGERVAGATGGGGMAEFMPVRAWPLQLVRIPASVSFEEAATVEPLADALQMVRLARVAPGEHVAIFGVGIIGLGVIQVLKALALDVGEIVAVDVSDARLAMASAVGATATINPGREPLLEAAARVCGTMPAVFPPMSPPNVAVVFDCAGYSRHMTGPPPLQQAFDLLRPSGGRVICFGLFDDEMTLNATPIILKQLTVCGSLGYAPEELAQAMTLMAEKKVDRGRLISHRFALEDVTRAFEVQGSGSAIKVMIQPQSGGASERKTQTTGSRSQIREN